MQRPWTKLLAISMVLSLTAAACGSDDEPDAEPSASAVQGDPDVDTSEAPETTEPIGAPATTEPTEAPATTEPIEATAVEVPGFSTWEEVLTAAEGTTVNFYMWGGSDVLNGWVDEYLGGELKDLYDIKLNRVPIANTGDVVNQLLAEKQAGVTENGTVDMVWINGDNYRTLREAELLLGSWSEGIPNSVYVNWSDPSIANDFGTPVDGYESPWGSAQFVFEYNEATVADPPRTFEALQSWIHENPGGFTYPAPPDFHGLSFVKHVFTWAAEDPSVLQQPFDQAAYDAIAPKVWEYLNDIEGDLWRGGDTYPASIAALQDLLANSEVVFAMRLDPRNAALRIDDGTYPDTIRTFVMDTGTLANKNFIAVPSNAPNAAAAFVAANHILSPEFQLIMADPDRWGWLIPTDTTKWTADQQATLASYDRGDATLGFAELAAAALPEPDASWVPQIEAGWLENVLQG